MKRLNLEKLGTFGMSFISGAFLGKSVNELDEIEKIHTTDCVGNEICNSVTFRDKTRFVHIDSVHGLATNCGIDSVNLDDIKKIPEIIEFIDSVTPDDVMHFHELNRRK